MHYRGRHRQVANRQQRLRRTGTIAAITLSALIAPLAVSGPVASQATTTAPEFDTLANHPEWRVALEHPSIAAEVADFKRFLVEEKRSTNPAALVAYAVPTVEGRVTVVTARPDTFFVTVNASRTMRFPVNGDGSDLQTRYGTAVPDSDGHAVVAVPAGAGPGGIAVPSQLSILTTAFNDAWETINNAPGKTDVYALIDKVKQELADSIDADPEAVIATVLALIDDMELIAERAVMQAMLQVTTLIDGLPTSDELVEAVLAAIGPAVSTIEQLKTYLTEYIGTIDVMGRVNELLQDVPTDPTVLIASVQALLDSVTRQVPPVAVPPTVTALVETAKAIVAEVDPETAADVVYDIVPFAAPALAVNKETTTNDPTALHSQPLYQPVDGLADAPVAGAVYDEVPPPQRDLPEWNRNNDDCYLNTSNAWYRRVCWNLDNQINDDSSTYTYWQLNLEASSYPKQKRGMGYTWVEAKPHNGEGVAPQAFDGSLPKPNQVVGGESGCSTRSESIQVQGGKPVQVGTGYSFSVTTCETYTPKGYDHQGHWSNKWSFNRDRDKFGVGYREEGTHMRHVALTMGVKTTATGKVPSWGLLTGTHVTKRAWYDG